jgi:hypothetical protein
MFPAQEFDRMEERFNHELERMTEKLQNAQYQVKYPCFDDYKFQVSYPCFDDFKFYQTFSIFNVKLECLLHTTHFVFISIPSLKLPLGRIEKSCIHKLAVALYHSVNIKNNE